MPGGPGDLYAAAQALLAAASDALELTPAPAGAIPYQAIWLGLPAFDCAPALFVHHGGPSVGDTYPLQPPLQPMQRIVTTGLVNLVQFTITVIRCVPVIEQESQTILNPDPVLISQAAADSYGDLWAIWNWLINRHRDGSLFQKPSGRREFILDPANSVRTSGGIGGFEIPVRLELDGYA